MNTVDDLLNCLETGDFEAIIGLNENSWLEVKGAPYFLSGSKEKEKFELAKDVSALANSVGGIILIGFATERESTVAAESISECRPFDQKLFDSDQYRKLLREWVHPVLDAVDIRLFEDKAHPSKYVAAIVVAESTTAAGRPYLVAKMLDEAERVSGTQVGYYERKHDAIPPMTIARLHQLFSSGQQFGEINERLTGIEVAVKSFDDQNIMHRLPQA